MRISGPVVVALAVAVGLGLAACGASATPSPATQFDNQAWTLLLPDDLGYRPLTADPRSVWLTALVPFFPTGMTKRGFSIDAERQACDTSTSAQVANKILARLAPSVAPAATTRRIGANDVAIGTTASLASAAPTLTIAVLCGHERVVFFTAAGIAESDAERILSGFTFREPASSDIDPPSANP